MSISDGSKFFDEDQVFDKYIHHRSKPEHPNRIIEAPIVLELLSDIGDCDVLDVGCGFGEMAGYCIQHRCRSYTGFDASVRMVELAKSSYEDEKAVFQVAQVENWLYPAHSYDRIISRLVLHYIEDLPGIARKLYRTLRKGGHLVFSVEHPVMTSSMGKYRSEGRKEHWLVDEYFTEGERLHEWVDGTVRKYHRTVESHFAIFQEAGFSIEALREGKPIPDRFVSVETFRRRNRLPRYLIMKAKK